MPGRPKSGPPYPEVPEVYVVVTNPWGMNPTPRERRQVDFDRVGAWAQLVLREGGRTPSVECIYGMGTRDEIIILFPEGTDIIPLLGEHRWANMAKKWDGNPDDPRSTCAFIYNWRKHGDPANHNWSENFPDTRNVVVPAKSPYPAPSWTPPPPTLASFVHSIPRPLGPPRMPINQDQGQQPSPPKTLPPKATPCPSAPEPEDTTEPEQHGEDSDPTSASLFRPYEPPSQHPSHAQFLNPRRASDDDAPAPTPAPSSTTQLPEPKFVTKLDPYELEEDALRALKYEDEPVKLENIDPDNKPILPLALPEESKVKVETIDGKPCVPPGPGSQRPRDPRRRPAVPQPPAIQAYPQTYQATAELEDVVKAYFASIGAASSGAHVSPTESRSTPTSTPQPPATQVHQQPYQASAELTDAVNAYFQSAGTAPTGSANVSQTDPRSTPISIKREYEEVELEFSGKRIKIEEP